MREPIFATSVKDRGLRVGRRNRYGVAGAAPDPGQRTAPGTPRHSGRRRKHAWLSLFVLLLLWVPALPGRTLAQGALPAGTWEGYFDRSFSVGQTLYGVTISGSGNSHGDLHLQVAADGNITGSITSAKGRADWTTSGLGQEVTGFCEVHFEATVTGGSAQLNSAGLPAITLQIKSTLQSAQCDPADAAQAPKAPTSLALEPKTFSGGKVTGEKARFDTDMVESIIQNITKAGFAYSLTEYWELNSSAGSVEQILPGYEVYFLEGVPFKNTYTAAVNWNNQPPGKVVFSLGGQTQEVPATGGEVDATFDLGTIPAGKNTLEVTAITANGTASAPYDYEVDIVPLDPWAKKANFQAAQTGQQGTANVVFYRGKSTLPEQPIQLPYLDLSGIPLIGGKWGLPPFQLDVNLEATSGGGVSKETPISGKLALYLGSKEESSAMKADGKAATNLTDSALLLDHGKVNFLVDPPLQLERTVGAVDLIPGLASLYDIPVLGDFIKAINGIAGLKGKLTVKGDGQADVGVAPDKSALVFTKGHITPVLQVTVGVFLGNEGIAWLSVAGGGQGGFTINIAPTSELANCQGALLFEAAAGIWFAKPATFQAKYDLGTCKQANVGRTAGLALYLPPASVATSLPAQAARMSLPLTLPNGQSGATVLVPGAVPQATPALALGPQGRLAYTWTALDGASSLPVIMLRLYDGQSWGEPLQVNAGGTAGLSPNAAFDRNGHLVLAWVQAPTAGLSADSFPGEEFYRGFELAYATVDPASGKVTTQGTVTSDTTMDFAPQLARASDGSVWLAWLRSPGASLTGRADAPNGLLAARWEGNSWSQAETVTEQLVGTLSFHLAAKNRDNALLVADLDTDGNLTTAADREVVAFERASAGWGPLHRLTDDGEMDLAPLAAYTPEGQPVVAWRKGNALFGLEGSLDAAPQEWVAGGTATVPDTGNGTLLAGANGELALLWTDYSPNGQAVWLAHRPAAGAAWEDPRLLDEESAGLAVLSAVASPQGDLWLGFSRLSFWVDPLALNTPTLPTAADLLVLHTEPVLQPYTPTAVGGGAPSWPWFVGIGGGVLLLGGAGAGLLLRRRKVAPAR